MERWKQSDCLPGYAGIIEVSDLGNVRVRERKYRLRSRWGVVTEQTKPDQTITGEIHSTGYRVVPFYVDRKRHKFYVHRLVGLAFVDGYEDGLTVNHINGNKLDNRASNLEWVTLAENSRKQWEDGLVDLRADKNPNRKLDSLDVVDIRRRLSAGERIKDLAAEFSVSRSTIEFVGNGKRWASV